MASHPAGSPMPLGVIVQRRAEALLRRYHLDVVPPLAATASLADKIPIQSYGGGTLLTLPGRFQSVLYVWRLPNPDDCSVWAPKFFRGYSDAYYRFLDTIYGPVDPAGKSAFEIDHLFNKARAPGDFYIRLEAIPAQVNRIHGATFERLDSGSAIQMSRRSRGRDHRKMTFVSALKLAGLAPPRGQWDSERIGTATAYFVARGWPEADVRHSLQALLQVAEHR